MCTASCLAVFQNTVPGEERGEGQPGLGARVIHVSGTNVL